MSNCVKNVVLCDADLELQDEHEFEIFLTNLANTVKHQRSPSQPMTISWSNMFQLGCSEDSKTIKVGM